MSNTKKTPLKRSFYHNVYTLHYQLVLFYDTGISQIDEEVTRILESKINEICESWDCTIISVSFLGNIGIELILETNPSIQLSKLINVIKTASSRAANKETVFKWLHGYLINTAGERADKAKILAVGGDLFAIS